MQALTEWIKDLVILVMLAGSLELLIPTGGMKKYVRTTMGLLLVLSVAKPVVSLLGAPVSVLDGDRWVNSTPAVPASGLPSLGQVMERAQRFRERNRALADQHGRSALEVAAADAAEGVEGVARARVVAELDPGRTELRRLLVLVEPGSPGADGRVSPVRPVGQAESEPVAPLSPQLMGAVSRAVAAALGMSADDRRIQVERATEPRSGMGGGSP